MFKFPRKFHEPNGRSLIIFRLFRDGYSLLLFLNTVFRDKVEFFVYITNGMLKYDTLRNL